MTVIVLDKDIEERLERYAERVHRPAPELAAEVLRKYLEYEEWFVQAVEEGIRAADAGGLMDHEEVKARWEAKRAHLLDRTCRAGCG
ncbi:MAG: CopG family ribbon-helix-helix protein [Pseudomonadota bacterium]